VQDWGRRRLAYKINKKSEGNYVFINFQMPSAETKKFEQTLKLNDQLIRFLIVNKDAA
jgi:small subunit ribosomal protein S6